jgi:predicted peptidase
MLPLYLLLLIQVPEPTTVNGDSLGKPEDFRTNGPARGCIENVAVDLITGESAYLAYAGIHSGKLRVISEAGQIDIVHGDTFAKVSGRKISVSKKDSFRVVRSGRGSKTKYLFYAPTEYSDGEEYLNLIVSGSRIRGVKDDLQIVDRISLSRKLPEGCAMRYSYGWDMLFGDEPLSSDDAGQ